jgi:hypothetical protein
MSRTNSKSGDRRQKGGSTSHPSVDMLRHTPVFRPVGTRMLLGRKIRVDSEGRDRLGWYILDDRIKIEG